jgi:hypothetical protein
VVLTTHPLPAPWSRESTTVPLPPPLSAPSHLALESATGYRFDNTVFKLKLSFHIYESYTIRFFFTNSILKYVLCKSCLLNLQIRYSCFYCNLNALPHSGLGTIPHSWKTTGAKQVRRITLTAFRCGDTKDALLFTSRRVRTIKARYVAFYCAALCYEQWLQLFLCIFPLKYVHFLLILVY